MTDNHWHEHAMGTEHAIEEAKQLERVRIAAAQLRTAGAGTAWTAGLPPPLHAAGEDRHVPLVRLRRERPER